MIKDKLQSKIHKYTEWLLYEIHYSKEGIPEMTSIDFILDRHGHYPVWGYEIYEWWCKNVYKKKEEQK